jgi:hypothetical protein
LTREVTMSNRQGTMGTHTCRYVHACGDGRDKKAAGLTVKLRLRLLLFLLHNNLSNRQRAERLGFQRKGLIDKCGVRRRI